MSTPPDILEEPDLHPDLGRLVEDLRRTRPAADTARVEQTVALALDQLGSPLGDDDEVPAPPHLAAAIPGPTRRRRGLWLLLLLLLLLGGAIWLLFTGEDTLRGDSSSNSNQTETTDDGVEIDADTPAASRPKAKRDAKGKDGDEQGSADTGSNPDTPGGGTAAPSAGERPTRGGATPPTREPGGNGGGTGGGADPADRPTPTDPVDPTEPPVDPVDPVDPTPDPDPDPGTPDPTVPPVIPTPDPTCDPATGAGCTTPTPGGPIRRPTGPGTIGAGG